MYRVYIRPHQTQSLRVIYCNNQCTKSLNCSHSISIIHDRLYFIFLSFFFSLSSLFWSNFILHYTCDLCPIIKKKGVNSSWTILWFLVTIYGENTYIIWKAKKHVENESITKPHSRSSIGSYNQYSKTITRCTLYGFSFPTIWTPQNYCVEFAPIKFRQICPTLDVQFEGKACINVTKQRPLRYEVYIHPIDNFLKTSFLCFEGYVSLEI